jgi:hypothetical protein
MGPVPRWLRMLLLLVTAVAVLAPAPSGAAGDGFVREKTARRRALGYLRFATKEVQRGSILNAIAHMERDVVDRRYQAPVGAVDVDDWSATWDKLDHLRDTRDFDGLYLLVALLGYENHPYLTPALWDRIRQSLLAFKTWYTDPTPTQPDPADPTRDFDDSYYWTENHQILYHTIEYLLGQRFPAECFSIAGFEPTPDCSGAHEMTGAAHRERAREFIRRWMEDHWQAGFSEWLSNVYYQKDATPLLALVEFADEPEIASRAAILLDVLLLDVATHLQRNVFGSTHGRSYMKDKYRGPEDDTWGLCLLLFGKVKKAAYVSRGDAGATLFARSKRYRLPKVIEEAARSKGRSRSLARTNQSFAIDERGPVVPDPEYPAGHSFEDNEPNFTFWWGLGAQTIWQVVPLTVLDGDRYNLWNTGALRSFRSLRDLLGNPPDLDLGRNIAVSLWPAASLELLSEADTYTWRTRDYMLSTVQDWRKGANASQVHAWQVTFDQNALVFTTHPMNPVQPPSEWVGRDEGSPGYWTGTASMPRSAQYENVGIHIYSPLYSDGGTLGFFDYEAMTHAYFPRERFQDVQRVGRWIIARRGKGYLALYSWRPTEWQEYPADELALPATPFHRSFDLVAPGGPDNVWIVECGRQKDYGNFANFRAAIELAEVEVTPHPTELGHQTFDVDYRSPSQGRMRFGWDAPFVVRGKEIPLHGYPRVDNPWVTAERGDPVWEIRGRGSRVVLDWTAGTRSVGRR